MKRSIGVTLAAVVSLAGSVILLLPVVLGTIAALLSPDDPSMTPVTRVTALIGIGMMFLFCAWGIATAVGILRLCSWARWSILAFSAILVFSGASGAIILLSVPVPQIHGAPPGVARATLIGMAAFYAALALLGAFWLYFFNTSKVQAQFASGGMTQPPGGRPFSITLIAWYLLFGIAGYGLCALLPYPVILFGWILSAWPGRLVYAGLGLTSCWLGWGLLRMRPLSRILSIAYLSLTMLNGLTISLALNLWPQYAARYAAAQMALTPEFHYSANMGVLGLVVSAVCTIFTAVPIWFLVKTRRAFAAPSEGTSRVSEPAQPLEPTPPLT